MKNISAATTSVDRAVAAHAARRGREPAVDEVHGDVLVGVRHERQPGEDQHEEQELGDLEARRGSAG